MRSLAALSHLLAPSEHGVAMGPIVGRTIRSCADLTTVGVGMRCPVKIDRRLRFRLSPAHLRQHFAPGFSQQERRPEVRPSFTYERLPLQILDQGVDGAMADAQRVPCLRDLHATALRKKRKDIAHAIGPDGERRRFCALY